MYCENVAAHNILARQDLSLLTPTPPIHSSCCCLSRNDSHCAAKGRRNSYHGWRSLPLVPRTDNCLYQWRPRAISKSLNEISFFFYNFENYATCKEGFLSRNSSTLNCLISGQVGSHWVWNKMQTELVVKYNFLIMHILGITSIYLNRVLHVDRLLYLRRTANPSNCIITVQLDKFSGNRYFCPYWKAYHLALLLIGVHIGILAYHPFNFNSLHLKTYVFSTTDKP